MLTTENQLSDQARLDSIDVTLKPGDDTEDRLAIDLTKTLRQWGRNGCLIKDGYRVLVDVTDCDGTDWHVDMGVNPWFTLPDLKYGPAGESIYLCQVDQEIVAGRRLLTFEACREWDLPVKKGGVA